MTKTKSTANNPNSLFLTNSNLGAVTDLYQLTMAAGYLRNGMNSSSTFELWIRNLPEHRSFLIAAGLEQVLHYINNLRFTNEIINYLKGQQIFKDVDDSFYKYLKDFRFSGDLFAVPEGTVIFEEEPILRVTAPLIESQIIETYLLATINFQTMIASKAARVVLAAQGRDVVDYGTRRAHGPQAGTLAARACYISGCYGTSNVLAGYELGIPVKGTVAHSWIMAVGDELESFKKFHSSFPDNTILLIDTYDPLNGARLATNIGPKLKGVRIDSGDLLSVSKEVRKILNDAGMPKTIIIASGDLNEYKIDSLIKENAPINGFGVGTEMVISKDCPSLGCIYKLVEQEIDGKIVPKMKLSKDKATYPSKKQVFRLSNKDGLYMADIVGLEGETIDLNEAFSLQSSAFSLSKDWKVTYLLKPVVKNGNICCDLPGINEIQQTAKHNISCLPNVYKQLYPKKSYPVIKSKKLEEQKTINEREIYCSRT